MQRLTSFIRRPHLSKIIRKYSSEAEIEQKFYLKQPLDPIAAELMNKHEPDIIYSSYVENNKRPLQYRHRVIVHNLCERAKQRHRYEEAMRKPFSLALRYVSNTLEQPPKAKEFKKEEISPKSSSELNLNNERDLTRNIITNEQKLTIFRELNRRRRELEESEQKYPEKWMQDYETFDENDEEDLVPDSQFGTPDPSIPITNIPCHGCGARLQCADTSLSGYLPSELIRNQKESVLRVSACIKRSLSKNISFHLLRSRL